MNAFLVQIFANETFMSFYIGLMMAVMVLPMIALTIWYHCNIGKTKGGRRLMRRHSAIGTARPVRADDPAAGLRVVALLRNLTSTGSMAADIESGRYDAAARAMQHRVYRFILIWMAANAVLMGIIWYVIEVARPAAG